MQHRDRERLGFQTGRQKANDCVFLTLANCLKYSKYLNYLPKSYPIKITKNAAFARFEAKSGIFMPKY